MHLDANIHKFKAFNSRAGSPAQSGFQYVLSPFKTSSW